MRSTAGICVAIALALPWSPAVMPPSNMTVEKKEGFQTSVPAALLLDVESDSVLYEKNGDQLVAPASTRQADDARICVQRNQTGPRSSSTDEFVISENAWRKGGAPSHGSTMFAAIHSRISLDDLIHGIIIDSANDACIAIAEAHGRQRGRIRRQADQRAREIGLEKSTFTNATGYSDPNLRVTARELAKLARHIMQTYPEFYPLFSEREFTWNKIRQQNRNPLLAMGIGADGLKTGETSEAGLNLVGSAVQDDFRLIVVVTGAKSEKERADEARKLLEWGFHGFEARVLFAEGQTVAEAKVFGGDRSYVPLVGPGTIAADDAARRWRALGRARSSTRARAGSGQQGSEHRQAQGLAGRKPRPRSAAEGGRRHWQRQHVAPRDGCRHRAHDRPVPGRREPAMMQLMPCLRRNSKPR